MLTTEPIYPDRNVTAADFEAMNLRGDELMVSKVFSSIQGEGPLAGLRCVFVRLAGCNFGGKGVNGPGCSFCDSDFRLSEARRMKVEDLLRLINSTSPGAVKTHYWIGHTVRLVVLTGGEPMLQKGVRTLLSYAPKDMVFQFESNGTTMLKDAPSLGTPFHHSLLVVSPKVPEKRGPTKIPRYPPLQNAVKDRMDALKFLISSNVESPYHPVYLPKYAYETLSEGAVPVYLSPMAIYRTDVPSPKDVIMNAWDPATLDVEATEANYRTAADWCFREGFRLSIQQHLFANLE